MYSSEGSFLQTVSRPARGKKILDALRRFGRFVYYKRTGVVVFDGRTTTRALQGFRTKILMPRFLFSVIEHFLCSRQNNIRLEKSLPQPGPTDVFYAVQDFSQGKR